MHSLGINVLCGVGILTTPYAIKEGGWLGMLLLFALGGISCYTGILLKKCLDSSPGLVTYPDIGQAAFGITGRLCISVILFTTHNSQLTSSISLLFYNTISVLYSFSVNILFFTSFLQIVLYLELYVSKVDCYFLTISQFYSFFFPLYSFLLIISKESATILSRPVVWSTLLW